MGSNEVGKGVTGLDKGELGTMERLSLCPSVFLAVSVLST